MNFNSFTSKIDLFKTKELGKLAAQLKLAPKSRIDFSTETIKNNTPREASVLALFYPDENNQTRFLLTKRASYKGTHSAQISFPGGKTEQNDKTAVITALRETNEEVGIIPKNVEIIRQLSATYIPPSNFLVTPFLAYLKSKPIFKANHEVDTIIEVLLEDLLNKNTLSTIIMDTSYMKNTEVPCFKLNNYIVWGATAMILSEVKDLLK